MDLRGAYRASLAGNKLGRQCLNAGSVEYDIYQIGQNADCAPSCAHEFSALRMESFHSTPTVFSHAVLKASIIVLALKSQLQFL